MLDDLFEQAERWTYVSEDGGIHYESILQKEWEQSGEDFELLILCVEDNIVTEDGEDEEVINWGDVRRDYERNNS